MRRPRHSRLRQHSNLSPMSSGHALSSKRLAQSATSSAIDIEGESAVKPTVSVDIVSSGQVYRQLFDAGVSKPCNIFITDNKLLFKYVSSKYRHITIVINVAAGILLVTDFLAGILLARY